MSKHQIDSWLPPSEPDYVPTIIIWFIAAMTSGSFGFALGWAAARVWQ
jgi:hypothetical protein